MNHPLSVQQGLNPLRQIQSQLSQVLRNHGHSDSANQIDACNRNQPCRSRRCTLCTSLRTIAQRAHLKRQVKDWWTRCRRPVMFAITPTVADSCIDHRRRALDVVSSTRALIRMLPVSTWFACIETVPSEYGDSSLRTHTHVLAVLDSPPSGRGYVTESEWQDRLHNKWQATCPVIAESVHAKRLSTVDDALSWSCYSTKDANLQDSAIRTQAALRDPELFMAASDALWNVPRFFGPMSKSN